MMTSPHPRWARPEAEAEDPEWLAIREAPATIVKARRRQAAGTVEIIANAWQNAYRP
jgi:hypothetical protein